MRNRQRAFTLIELLIVVAIIGILAAIAVPNFLNAQVRAQVTRVIADMKAATDALEMFRLDNRRYIKTMGGASELFQLTTPIAYLNQVPKDYFIGNLKGAEINPDSRSNSWDYTGSDLGWGKKAPICYMLSSIGPAKSGHGPHMDFFGNGPNNWHAARFREAMYDFSNGIKSRGSIIHYGGDDSPLRHP